jgi:hypothetical protein
MNSQHEQLKQFAKILFTNVTSKDYFTQETNINIHDVANQVECVDGNSKIINKYINDYGAVANNNNIHIFIMNNACAKNINIYNENLPNMYDSEKPTSPPGSPIIPKNNIYYVVTQSGNEYDDSFVVYIAYLFRYVLPKQHVMIYTKDDYSRDQHDKANVYVRTLIDYGITELYNIINFNDLAEFPIYVNNVAKFPIRTDTLNFTFNEFKNQVEAIKMKCAQKKADAELLRIETIKQEKILRERLFASMKPKTTSSSSSSSRVIPVVKSEETLRAQLLAIRKAKLDAEQETTNTSVPVLPMMDIQDIERQTDATKKRKKENNKYLKYKNKYLELKKLLKN